MNHFLFLLSYVFNNLRSKINRFISKRWFWKRQLNCTKIINWPGHVADSLPSSQSFYPIVVRFCWKQSMQAASGTQCLWKIWPENHNRTCIRLYRSMKRIGRSFSRPRWVSSVVLNEARWAFKSQDPIF